MVNNQRQIESFLTNLNLSRDQLFAIFKFTEWSQLQRHHLFQGRHRLQNQLTELSKFLIKNKNITSPDNTGAYMAAIREEHGYQVMILWYLVGIVNLEPFLLLAFTSLFTALTMGVIATVINATYLAIEEEEKTNLEGWQLSALQNACVDWLLKQRNQRYNTSRTMQTITPAMMKNLTKEALELASIVSVVVFSLYATCQSVAVSLQLASATALLTSTMGVTLAVFSALGIAAYCGYKYYEYTYDKLLRTEAKESMDQEFAAKYCLVQSPARSPSNMVRIQPSPAVDRRVRRVAANNSPKMFQPAIASAGSQATQFAAAPARRSNRPYR